MSINDPFHLVDVLSQAFARDERAYVYAGRSNRGVMLVKWNGHKRVAFLAYETPNPIGRKRVHAAIQRLKTFKGHNVDVWVFLANAFRQNAHRLIDEFDVMLVELSNLDNSVTLTGTKNLPDTLGSVLLRTFESNGLATAYDFEGLVAPTGIHDDQQVRKIATKTPRITAFISYSWDSDEHRHWVLRIAADLIRNGVNVLIDEWDISDYGDDLNRFMEAGIRDSNFVIMICTPNYAKRANDRQGGVGVESSIITGEYYDAQNASKYIPIVRGETIDNSLPSYLKSRLAIKFTNQSYDASFESLLRRIAGRPRFKRPELGELPDLPSVEI